MIGVITVLARLVGFGRQVVFAHTVGTTCLGTAYTTANMVPNIIYDIVLGGALSSVVVPVLAGPAGLAGFGGRDRLPGGDGGQAAAARQISSALLTWTVVLLVPVSAVVAVAAHPIVSVLLSDAGGCPRADLAGVGARMLIVFAPQVLLYGMAVVLYGILQSHRRFGAPALAPLLSSLVVVGAYAGFGAVGGAYVNRLHSLPPMAEYLLSGGTTLGVLALVLTAVVPAWRLHLRMRPTFRFPAGVGPRVRRLAIAGVLTLVAQDASVAVVIVLANRYGSQGALVLYGFAWAVFVVPYAVLAVPIATSTFPELSATSAATGVVSEPGAGVPGAVARGIADRGVAARDAAARDAVAMDVAARGGAAPDGAGVPPPGHPSARLFDATAAASTRAVMLASWLGAAALVGARLPLARVFESHSASAASILAVALAAFAPGLVGYGLSANLSRVLYARGRNRSPALAMSAGWVLVIVADLLIVPFVPRPRVVPALGVGTSIGLTVAGVALLVLVRRERGGAALAGVSRAFLAGLVGCAAGAAAGSAISVMLRVHGFFPNVGVSVLVSAVVTAVFVAVVMNLDGGDLRTAFRRLRHRVPAVEP
jgi:peptidoglycan biosynthesis protein MviN/MurJ (putative lipid II flippase)